MKEGQSQVAQASAAIRDSVKPKAGRRSRQLLSELLKFADCGRSLIAAKERELEQLRGMHKYGARSPTVAQAAISKAEEELPGMAARRPGRPRRPPTRSPRSSPRRQRTTGRRSLG